MSKNYFKPMAAILSLVLVFALLMPLTAFAAFDDSQLTWDGKAATLKEIAANLDFDMVDANGNYKPLYYAGAVELWNLGLMLGSDGSFSLDKPLTRTEGIIMALRLLGKEQTAIDSKLACPFTDVPDWARYQVAYAAKEGLTTGYSATVFGANDAMTANQYITFVLRAMGYSDNDGDFIWSSAADKALEIGLIVQPCYNQYTRSNLFLRDDVALISYKALNETKCKDGKLLIDKISVPGKPSGTVPIAIREEKAAEDPSIVNPSNIVCTVAQEDDYTSYAFGRITGQYINGTLMKGAHNYWVSLTVTSGSGQLELSEYIDGAWSTRTLTVEAGNTYNISPQASYAFTYTLKVGGQTYENLKVGIAYVPA